jgi:hyperosmotically inducible protein
MRRVLPVLLMLAAGSPGPASAQEEPRAAREIRGVLSDLPLYGVFDVLSFDYDKGRVTLSGSVTDAALKDAAEKAVRKVEGVESVTNRIRTLPTSKADTDLRAKLFAAIYRDSPLERYEKADESRSAIRILVDRGNVRLVGVVDRLEDKELAGLKAKGVFGVREVANDLKTKAQVEAQ